MQHLLQKVVRGAGVPFADVPFEHLGGVTDQLTLRERTFSKAPSLYLLRHNLHEQQTRLSMRHFVG